MTDRPDRRGTYAHTPDADCCYHGVPLHARTKAGEPTCPYCRDGEAGYPLQRHYWASPAPAPSEEPA